MPARIHDLVPDDSLFIIITTHPPILMACPDALIYHCGRDGMQRVAYEDTGHFRVTRDFLANPGRVPRTLLAADRTDDADTG